MRLLGHRIPCVSGGSLLHLCGVLIAVATVAWEEYARSLHAFLARLGTGVEVDFGSRRLIGIGHSIGTTATYVDFFSDK